MEKQQKIVEMAKDICRHQNVCNDVCKPISACDALRYAERAVEAGYVKQSEGEWVQLPCKVGDILYVISQMKDKRILPFISEYEVTSIEIKRKSINVYHAMDGYIKIFKGSDFGKTIFLTEEEAEQVVTDIIVGGK